MNAHLSRSLSSTLTLLALLGGALGCVVPKITSPDSASGRVGEEFTYQIAATRNPTSFSATVPPPAGLSLDPTTGRLGGVPLEAGDFDVRLGARNASGKGTKRLALSIAPATGGAAHVVVPEKELFITAPAVLASAQARAGGSWHFRSALERIAGPGTDLETFAERWFSTWANNDSVAAVTERFARRPWVAEALREAWRNDRIRLIAIVNRLDLTRFPDGDVSRPPTSLGEGRFVYEATTAAGVSLPLTLIFEYALPAEGDLAVSLENWAKRWHALGRAELGGAAEFPPAYFDELVAITTRYSAHGQLNQIRSNEFLDRPDGTASEWELREFHFVGTPAQLVQVPVALTPAIALRDTPALASLIRAQEAGIVGGGSLALTPAEQAAVSPVPFGFKWQAPGAPARAMFVASFNTCSGCHAGDTGTLFQHIGARSPGGSPFVTREIDVAQPLPPQTNTRLKHDEMAERSRLLAAFAGDDVVLRTGAPSMNLRELIKARMGRPH